MCDYIIHPTTSKLRTLDISMNKLTDITGFKLAHALEYNRSL